MPREKRHRYLIRPRRRTRILRRRQPQVSQPPRQAQRRARAHLRRHLRRPLCLRPPSILINNRSPQHPRPVRCRQQATHPRTRRTRQHQWKALHRWRHRGWRARTPRVLRRATATHSPRLPKLSFTSQLRSIQERTPATRTSAITAPCPIPHRRQRTTTVSSNHRQSPRSRRNPSIPARPRRRTCPYSAPIPTRPQIERRMRRGLPISARLRIRPLPGCLAIPQSIHRTVQGQSKHRA